MIPLRWGIRHAPWTGDLLYESDFVTPEIGWHFAGLVDGEGCFSISRRGYPSFILKMRGDDRALLERVQRDLGHPGRITTGKPSGEGNRHPWVRWEITRRRELLWLTEVFDAYPLRSKKARDYAIWREAVIDWSAGYAPDQVAKRHHEALRAVREYAEAGDVAT